MPSDTDRRVPHSDDPHSLVLIDQQTGENFTFETEEEVPLFKHQRYAQRYLATIHAVDANVGRMLDWLDEEGLTENTIVFRTQIKSSFGGKVRSVLEEAVP